MSWYTFVQHNPDGSFRGPAHYVIVEAVSTDEALKRLSENVEDAGNAERWGVPVSVDTVPTIYGETAETFQAVFEYAEKECAARVAVLPLEGAPLYYGKVKAWPPQKL